MKLPEPFVLSPRAPDLAEAIARIPESPGIYALSADGTAPHLGWSINLKRRLKRLLVSPAAGTSFQIRDNLDRVSCWLTGSRLEIALIMYELAKCYDPDGYLKQLRLRLPWFVSMAATGNFARLEVGNRLARKGASAFGPFLTRDLAQRYEEEVLALFQLRRCTERLEPRTDHPGCIYGEMNQCLRPCQGAVSSEEYAAESARVLDFLSTNGKTSATTLSIARQKASSDLDFELASQIHKRLERVSAAIAVRDRTIQAVDDFNGVALTPASGNRQFRLWPMVAGYWQEPVGVDLPAVVHGAKSLDHELRESLESSLAVVQTEGRRAEHFALFSRWYYSSWRDGHWFPFQKLEDLNYRRLVRELSKMAAAAT